MYAFIHLLGALGFTNSIVLLTFRVSTLSARECIVRNVGNRGKKQG